jgi:exodeoxyribonuclease VII small subunit
MAKKNHPVPRSFEEALAELEKILADLEAGEVGLEESLSRYERGTFLIQHCRTVLGAAEKQIELLVKNEQGHLEPEPIADPGRESADPD